jgi:hypothetical protein
MDPHRHLIVNTKPKIINRTNNVSYG